MDKFLAWLFVSSADPKRWSLTVKAIVIGAIPTIIHLAGMACGVGLVCVGVDSDSLNALAQHLETLVFAILTGIAAVIGIYGFLRKLILTILGKNKAI